MMENLKCTELFLRNKIFIKFIIALVSLFSIFMFSLDTANAKSKPVKHNTIHSNRVVKKNHIQNNLKRNNPVYVRTSKRMNRNRNSRKYSSKRLPQTGESRKLLIGQVIAGVTALSINLLLVAFNSNLRMKKCNS